MSKPCEILIHFCYFHIKVLKPKHFPLKIPSDILDNLLNQITICLIISSSYFCFLGVFLGTEAPGKLVLVLAMGFDETTLDIWP